jgi:hypothetical protein
MNANLATFPLSSRVLKSGLMMTIERVARPRATRSVVIIQSTCWVRLGLALSGVQNQLMQGK